MSCLSDVTWALDGAITSITEQHIDPCFIVCCDSLGNQFFYVCVQEYEDKRVEEALRQEKTVKDGGDRGSKSKIRHEPFSFQDGMIYAVRY
jgi:hypothetical protein